MKGFHRLASQMLVGALCMCSCVPTAAAQPRTFGAIRTIELEPALPGTEKVHKQLGELLARLNGEPAPPRDVYLRLEKTRRPAPEGDQRAKCTLRTDLSKPRRIGLECCDAAGGYIGTLRSRTYNELGDRLLHYKLLTGGPGARPLTYYRLIHVKVVPFNGLEQPAWVGEYVSDLLRVDGTWQVVTSLETLSGEDADRLVECEVAPLISASGPWWLTTVNAAMLLRDSAGEHVARVIAGSRQGIRSRLEALVRALLEERRNDDEIYRASPG